MVDDALASEESTQESYKLIPTSEDWFGAKRMIDTVECPVCFVPINYSSIDKHTAWHQTLADIVKTLVGG